LGRFNLFLSRESWRSVLKIKREDAGEVKLRWDKFVIGQS